MHIHSDDEAIDVLYTGESVKDCKRWIKAEQGKNKKTSKKIKSCI